MDGERLLLDNLQLLQRIIDRVCRRAGLIGADAEDFASVVKLALVENDYAVLRAYEGRAPLAAYLAVFVQRTYADQWIQLTGRWRPSAEARRHGDAGVLIDRLVHRERRSLQEAFPIVSAAHPGITKERMEAIAATLPTHSRKPRAVELDDAVAETAVAAGSADAAVVEDEARRTAARTAEAIRETMSRFTTEERMILRLRYGDDLSIADIARMTRLPQRPLYRRVESMLEKLRSALAEARISAGDLPALLDETDFGLRQNDASGQT